MLNRVIEVNVNDKKIFLIGTAHISDESIELVRKTILEEKPDFVAVELCQQRYDALLNIKKWDQTEIDEVIKSGKTHMFFMQLLLANFQKKLGDSVGIKPGSEMMEAIKIAEMNGIKIALVDRDIKITLKRALGLIPMTEKAKLVFSIIEGILVDTEISKELLEKLKERDIFNELMEDLAREIPSIKKILIDERDLYIANKILNIDGKKIVAVVGAGHLEGIKKSLESLYISKSDIEKLEEVPKEKNTLRYIGYIFIIAFFALLIWGFYAKGTDMAIKMFSMWFWLHGILAALGVMLAMGHPLTVIITFFAAPFTALHPGIAAGWVAGLVELKMRKPMVMDFENLMKMKKIRDYWNNRVTRIFLIIIFANIGGSIATFIALPYMASLL